MNGELARVALVTADYPPHATEIARAARRLAEGVARMRCPVLVMVGARLGEEPPPLVPPSPREPSVLRLSSPIEGLALLQTIEEESGPVSLFHAITRPSALQCLGIAPRGVPVVATLRDADGEPATEEIEQLRRAACVTALYARPLAPLRQRKGVDGPVLAIVPPAIEVSWREVMWPPPTARAGVVAVAIDRRSPGDRALAVDIYRALPRGVASHLRFVSDEEPQLSHGGTRAERCERWRHVRALIVLSIDEHAWLLVCEASACGVPVVAFAQEDVQRTFTHDVSALIAPAGDAAACTAMAAAVLTNDGLASRLSAGARKAALRMTASDELAAFLRLYAAVLQ